MKLAKASCFVLSLVVVAGGCNSGILPGTPAARTIAACNRGVNRMEAMGCFSQQEIDTRRTYCDDLVELYEGTSGAGCDFTDVFNCIEDRLDCDTGVEVALCLLELSPEEVERCPEFFDITP